MIENLTVECKIQILSYLSPKEIQRAHRISKNFDAVIKANLTQLAMIVHKRNSKKLERKFNQVFQIQSADPDEFLEILSRFDLHCRLTRTRLSNSFTSAYAAMYYLNQDMALGPNMSIDTERDLVYGLSSVAILCYRMRFIDWTDEGPRLINTAAEPSNFTPHLTGWPFPGLPTQLGIGEEKLRKWFAKVLKKEYFTSHLYEVGGEPTISEPLARTPFAIRSEATDERLDMTPVHCLDEEEFYEFLGLPRIPASVRRGFAWCIRDGPAVDLVRKVTKGEIKNPLVKAWLLEEMYLF
ncbi:hypothetical protein BST61_g29 [Cercospora zeina]